MEKKSPQYNKASLQANNLEKEKKSVSLLKKIITVLLLIPIVPIIFFVSLLLTSQKSSSGTTATTTVDQRFSLSSMIKSTYRDTQKGAFNYTFAYCGDPHMQETGSDNFPKLDETIKASKPIFVVFGGEQRVRRPALLGEHRDLPRPAGSVPNLLP